MCFDKGRESVVLNKHVAAFKQEKAGYIDVEMELCHSNK